MNGADSVLDFPVFFHPNFKIALRTVFFFYIVQKWKAQTNAQNGSLKFSLGC